MNILTDEQIAELIHETNKATKSFKLHPLYEYEKFLIDAAYQETLKMVLDIVDKHWAGYCDFEDKRACLEILENIHDGIEALKQSGEE